MNDIEARLESMIMTNARDTAISVRLSFLIELQRHVMHMTSMLSEAEEVNAASINDIVEVINDHHRGALPNVDQVVSRLIELVGWEEPHDDPS